MIDAVRRLATFTLSASVVAFVVFLIVGTAIQVRANERMRTVVARDVVGPNVHRISGMVMVSSTCTMLSVHPVQISPVAYKLPFETWENPDAECAQSPTAIPFHTTVFAPASGVTFIATLDDSPLPIIVTPVLPL